LATTVKKIGRVSTESVFKATQKHWDQWLAILERAGARNWTHAEIVAFLKTKHKLRPWWQQVVSLSYQISIGRRIEGQNAKGQYSLTVTKSLYADVKKTWKLLASKEGMELWLRPMYAVAVKAGNHFETQDGYFGEFRTMLKERRIRMTWQDPNWEKATVVQILLVGRPKEKSILVFTNDQIRDLKTQASLRKRWKDAVGEFASRLNPKGVETK
jgi:uncharacterized protein YndB with AHSA1/START domain